MKNLLFFLWMMFAPIVEDIAGLICWKIKGEKKNDEYDSAAALFYFIVYLIVGWMLYD